MPYIHTGHNAINNIMESKATIPIISSLGYTPRITSEKRTLFFKNTFHHSHIGSILTLMLSSTLHEVLWIIIWSMNHGRNDMPILWSKWNIFKVVFGHCPRFHMKHDDVIKWKHFPRYWPFCAGISPIAGEFPAQRPVTRSFDVFFDLRLNQQLSKWCRRWCFETPSRSLWRHCNGPAAEKTGEIYTVQTGACHIMQRRVCMQSNSSTV